MEFPKEISLSSLRLRGCYHEPLPAATMGRRSKKGRARSGFGANDLEALHEIGASLIAERDLRRLLQTILEKSCQFVSADAGTLFLAENEGNEPPCHLRFMLTLNHSIPIALKEFVIPIDPNSLAGQVAIKKDPLRLTDVYELPPKLSLQFKREIDEKTGYRSKSLLAIPLVDHQDELIGVLQIWNKKRHRSTKLTSRNTEKEVIPFTLADQKLLSSLGAQAAVAIENARLYSDIEALFEGFVRASVVAIEARDPTTSGHSARVSELTLGLCQAINRCKKAPWKNHSFSPMQLRQIRYAALLHDFGKIGVKESVLLKSKKLYTSELEIILERLDLARRTLQLEMSERKVEYLVNGGQVADRAWKDIEALLAKRMEGIDQTQELILNQNEPTVVDKAVSDQLDLLSGFRFPRPSGDDCMIIEDEQVERLALRRGTLSIEERLAIESHVTHTYEFLRRIPWTKDLRPVPDIAHAHHEMLNGTGYPRKLKVKSIPVPARAMAVADIFDALVAQDRPYKKAVTVSRAIEILNAEASNGRLEPTLVRMFIEQEIYKRTTEPE